MKKTALILVLAIAVLMACFVPGCAKEPENSDPETGITGSEDTTSASSEEIAAYMASVTAQSEAINTSLEQDPLTQLEMNMKSMEQYELWNNAVDYLMGELKNRLPEEEFTKLQNDQLVWAAERDAAAEEAGKEFEGGSFHSFIVASNAAAITEERALELYEMLK